MIAKILAKGSATDIVGYVMREFHDKEQYTADTWRVIDSDGILGSDYRRIVDSFDIGASLNRRISKPIGHIAGERIHGTDGYTRHTISDCATSRNLIASFPYCI